MYLIIIALVIVAGVMLWNNFSGNDYDIGDSYDNDDNDSGDSGDSDGGDGGGD